MKKMHVLLNVNGENRNLLVEPSEILLDTLRNQLGLTGAKPGCLNGDCGACTVLIDDWPIKSCLTLTLEVVNKKITTIEGLENADVQKAFIENWGFQCGYCTSGFLLVCHSLTKMKPNADDTILQDWLQSNICRCTSYSEIEDAIKTLLVKPLS